MLKEKFLDALMENPVIAAVKDDRFLEAIESPCKVVFLLSVTLPIFGFKAIGS